MQRNIFAYTAPGIAPEYLSINRQDDGTIRVSVRGPLGRTADMTLPVEQLVELAKACAGVE